MRVFFETPDLIEVHDFTVKTTTENPKLQEVILSLLKLKLPVGEGFEYIAIMDPAGATEIRHVRNRKYCDPWNQGKEQPIGKNIGFWMCFFQGTLIDSEEVLNFVQRGTLLTWIEMNKDSIREISYLA